MHAGFAGSALVNILVPAVHPRMGTQNTPADANPLLEPPGFMMVAGIIGFFYESEFTDEKSVRDAVFGILDVNGWHNVVHIATGALGLLAFAGGAYAARAYALGLGARLHSGCDLGLHSR